MCDVVLALSLIYIANVVGERFLNDAARVKSRVCAADDPQPELTAGERTGGTASAAHRNSHSEAVAHRDSVRREKLLGRTDGTTSGNAGLMLVSLRL